MKKLFWERGLVDAILRSTYEWTTSGRIFQVFLIKGRVTFSAAGAFFSSCFFLHSFMLHNDGTSEGGGGNALALNKFAAISRESFSLLNFCYIALSNVFIEYVFVSFVSFFSFLNFIPLYHSYM